jgi:DNA-nicking Smr family endonuclease
MKRRAHLSAEEWALWAHVAESVRPMPGRKAIIAPRPPKAEPAVSPKEQGAAFAAQQPQATGSRLLPLAPIERRLRQRVTRGQAPVDGVIDLHGMRQDEAHRALLGFIQRKHHEGAAMVIVITGKGSTAGEDREKGVLKRMVPHWLSDPALRRCVIGFEDASQRHGGQGALYVRIRRVRE